MTVENKKLSSVVLIASDEDIEQLKSYSSRNTEVATNPLTVWIVE